MVVHNVDQRLLEGSSEAEEKKLTCCVTVESGTLLDEVDQELEESRSGAWRA